MQLTPEAAGFGLTCLDWTGLDSGLGSAWLGSARLGSAWPGLAWPGLGSRGCCALTSQDQQSCGLPVGVMVDWPCCWRIVRSCEYESPYPGLAHPCHCTTVPIGLICAEKGGVWCARACSVLAPADRPCGPLVCCETQTVIGRRCVTTSRHGICASHASMRPCEK